MVHARVANLNLLWLTYRVVGGGNFRSDVCSQFKFEYSSTDGRNNITVIIVIYVIINLHMIAVSSIISSCSYDVNFFKASISVIVIQNSPFNFLAGRRKCLGEQLALMELFLFLTHLLHRFKFRLPEDAPTPCLQGIMGATLAPESYEVCAISRPLN